MPKTAVVIDDDSDDIMFMLDAIAHVDSSVECISFSDPQGAMAFILQSRSRTVPDYVFIDRNMPKLGGDACLALIKQLPSLSGIKVIMISTSMDEDDSERFMKAGAYAALKKPNRLDDYYPLVRDIFNSNGDFLLAN